MAFRATAELRPTHEREPEYNGVHSWRKAVRMRGICRVPNKTRSSASVNWTDRTVTCPGCRYSNDARPASVEQTCSSHHPIRVTTAPKRVPPGSTDDADADESSTGRHTAVEKNRRMLLSAR